MGTERSEYLLVVLDKSYLEAEEEQQTMTRAPIKPALSELTFQCRIHGGRGKGCRYIIGINRLSIHSRCRIIDISLWRTGAIVRRRIVVGLRLCFGWCNRCTWDMARSRRSSTARRSWDWNRWWAFKSHIKKLSWLLPELGEFWLPRDEVRGGWGPVGGLPFRGLPGGNVSVIDIKLAIGVCNDATDVVIDASPNETLGRLIPAG